MIKKLEKLLKLLNNIDFAEIKGNYHADWTEISGAPYRCEGNLEEIIDYIYDLYFDDDLPFYNDPISRNPLTLAEVRKQLKDSDNGVFGKITVIKRNGKIFCREDIGSPRNSNLKMDMFNGHVKRTLDIKNTIVSLFSGRKGIYTNYWVEVVINENL